MITADLITPGSAERAVPTWLPSSLLSVRIDGWRSHVRTRLVYSGDRLERGVDCRTQDDFATLLRLYGMPT